MPTFIRLTDYKDSDTKEQQFANPANRHTANQNDFSKIPGSPIAYWVSDRVKEIFEKSSSLESISDIKTGIQTGNNEQFLRFWNEVNIQKIGFNLESCEDELYPLLKWFPYLKGGEFRKWIGNFEYVVNLENDGYEIKQGNNFRLRDKNFYFKKSISWSFVSSGTFAVRFTPNGFTCDVAGSSLYPSVENINYLTSFLNSLNTKLFLKIVAPTINFQIEDIASLPIIFPKQDSIKQTRAPLKTHLKS